MVQYWPVSTVIKVETQFYGIFSRYLLGDDQVELIVSLLLSWVVPLLSFTGQNMEHVTRGKYKR